MILNCDDIDNCFSLVKLSIEFGLKHECPLSLSQTSFSSEMKQKSNLFVSLTNNNKNVGCYGSPRLNKPLYESILSNSFMAGFKDKEFPSLNKNRLIDLEVELIFLDSAGNSGIILDIDDFCNDLKSGDCVSLRYKDKEALFFNNTQTLFADKREFMLALKEKAAIGRDIPWYFINATKTSTVVSYKRKYSEIKCLPITQ